jgi:hypothetical protein
MSAEVVQLKRPVHENIVATIKELLAHAEAGEVIALAYAYETNEGAGGWHASHGKGSRPATLLGSLFEAAYQIAARSSEPNEGSE